MEVPSQLQSHSSSSYSYVWVIPPQENEFLLVQNQQFFTLNHQCLTINEARAKGEYLQQLDVVGSLSSCLQSSITQINIFEDNLKQLWIQCHIKPHGHELEYNQYQNNFNRYISDNFQINCFQLTRQIQDEKPEIIMNAIQKYNEENNEVYIQCTNMLKYENLQDYQLLVSIYLQRKIPYELLLEKLKLHRNRISEIFDCQKYFQIKNEEQAKVWKHHTSKILENQSNIKINQLQQSICGEYGQITKLIKMIENSLEKQKYYQLSFQLQFSMDRYKINELNVFQNKLKQIGQKSKDSTIGLLGFTTQFEFFIICEPIYLKKIKINIQHDLIDNLQVQKFEANLKEFLFCLQLSKEDFQLIYEIIVIFDNDECFQLFGLSSSLKSINQLIFPFKILSHKISFDSNLVFFQLKKQYHQIFKELPCKLEFQQNKSIKISCQQDQLDECIAKILTQAKNIQQRIFSKNCSFDKLAIQYLKKYSPEYLAQIQLNYQTSIKFNKIYQFIYGTGQPLKMKEQKKTIQLTNNGIFSLDYDALISLGQGNKTIDEIVPNIKAMMDIDNNAISESQQFSGDDDQSLYLQIPKNQQQYQFSSLFVLRFKGKNIEKTLIDLYQKFVSLAIKSFAISIPETDRAFNIKQIIDFFFINNETQIETVYIIEENLVRLLAYEEEIYKNFNFSNGNNRQWEMRNFHEYIKISENLNEQINQVFDQFQQTRIVQKKQLVNQNSNEQFCINFDYKEMTLSKLKNKDSKEIRMKKLLHFDEVTLESFSTNEWEQVYCKLQKKLSDLYQGIY